MLFPQMFLKLRGGGGYFPCIFFTFAARSATELVKPHALIWGLQNAAVSIKAPCSHGSACQNLYSFHTLRTILTSGLLLHPHKIPVRQDDRGQWHHFTDEEMETQNCTWLIQHHVVGTGRWVMLTPSWPSACSGLGSSWKKEGARPSENTDPASNPSSATYSSVCVST